jgi:hypothetical protein
MGTIERGYDAAAIKIYIVRGCEDVMKIDDLRRLLC